MELMDFMKSAVVEDFEPYRIPIREFRMWLKEFPSGEVVGQPNASRRCPVFKYVKSIDSTVFAVVPGSIIFKNEAGYVSRSLSFSISEFIKLVDVVFCGRSEGLYKEQLLSLLDSFASENSAPLIIEEM